MTCLHRWRVTPDLKIGTVECERCGEIGNLGKAFDSVLDLAQPSNGEHDKIAGMISDGA